MRGIYGYEISYRFCKFLSHNFAASSSALDKINNAENALTRPTTALTFSRTQIQTESVRPYCTVRPYSTANLGFLGTAVRVRVRPKIIAVRRTILLLHFLIISNLNSVRKKLCFASHFPNNKVLTRGPNLRKE